MHLTWVSVCVAAAAVSASVIPRSSVDETWLVTNFTASSKNGEAYKYHMKVHKDGHHTNCYASNAVPSTTCLGADTPAPFSNTTCGVYRDSAFSWALNLTESPEEGGGEIFSLKVAFNEPGQQGLYACRLIPITTQCTFGAKNESMWVGAAQTFNLTVSTDPMCVYA